MRLSIHPYWQVGSMHFRHIQSLSVTMLNGSDAMLNFLVNIPENADHHQINGPPCSSQCTRCHMPNELVLC